MRSLRVFSASLLAALLFSVTSAPEARAQILELELLPITGLQGPVALKSPPGDFQRMFVAEYQTGRVRIIKNGVLLPTPFLDLGGQISIGGERGLLDIAFHPNYAQNTKFYVSLTNTSGATEVREYRSWPQTPDVAEPASMRLMFGPYPQPDDSHNGGCLQFGPDGMLYLGIGDGGFSMQGDPQNYAQRLDSYLGKLLRIDVNTPTKIPATNPFLDTPGALPLIWAYGLRNPWRFSFDRVTGDLWLTDVGQFTKEEINLAVAGSPGGRNYGWRTMEGTQCTGYSSGPCPPSGVTQPFYEYNHFTPDFQTFIGCAIIGGYVYRGGDMPLFRGRYLYADYCTQRVWSLKRLPGGALEIIEHTSELAQYNLGNIVSFGEDARGEVYLLENFNNRIWRLKQRSILAPGITLPYGCGTNPPESLALLAGQPDIGKVLTLGLSNPAGTQIPGSVGFLAVSLQADPNFPCGTLLPTLGMNAPMAAGELLIGGAPVFTPPAIWPGNGQSALFNLPLPFEISLYQLPLFVQGLMLDPLTGKVALSAAKLFVLGA